MELHNFTFVKLDLIFRRTLKVFCIKKPPENDNFLSGGFEGLKAFYEFFEKKKLDRKFFLSKMSELITLLNCHFKTGILTGNL